MIVGERRSHVRRAEDVILDDRMWRVVSDGSKRRRSHGRHVQRRHGRDATDGRILKPTHQGQHRTGGTGRSRTRRTAAARSSGDSRGLSAVVYSKLVASGQQRTVTRSSGLVLTSPSNGGVVAPRLSHHTTSRGSRGCRPVSRERPAVSRRGLSAMPRDRRPGSRLNAGAAT